MTTTRRPSSVELGDNVSKQGRDKGPTDLQASFHTVDGRNPAPLGNHGKPLFVGIYRGMIIPGFLSIFCWGGALGPGPEQALSSKTHWQPLWGFRHGR